MELTADSPAPAAHALSLRARPAAVGVAGGRAQRGNRRRGAGTGGRVSPQPERPALPTALSWQSPGSCPTLANRWSVSIEIPVCDTKIHAGGKLPLWNLEFSYFSQFHVSHFISFEKAVVVFKLLKIKALT